MYVSNKSHCNLKYVHITYLLVILNAHPLKKNLHVCF
uniref:Uncharacterized protein n=1 Tax=Picea sitchensis TaxID=3332 RepID=D5AAF4_PICSI|nr:unknown [Picea sitchensis]